MIRWGQTRAGRVRCAPTRGSYHFKWLLPCESRPLALPNTVPCHRWSRTEMLIVEISRPSPVDEAWLMSKLMKIDCAQVINERAP